MKRLLSLITCVLMLLIVSSISAKDDSFFPKPADVNSGKPSLSSAIAQFEGLVENSVGSDMQSLKANDNYNQQRVIKLQKQLTAKKEYLATIPDVVSRQFDALMKQYANSDQQTRNKMADQLHAEWKAKEATVKREIAELEEQLAVTTTRISDSAIKGQMLQISDSLAKGEKAMRQKAEEEKVDPQAESTAFKEMKGLSQKRVLSKVNAISAINVKPLQSDFSVKQLDK